MLHPSLEYRSLSLGLRTATSLRQLMNWTAVLAVAALSFGCDWEVEGNGEPATETRKHENFVSVQSETTVNIAIRQGDVFDVRVNIDSNLVDLLETRVSGHRLVIDSERSLDPHVKGPHVTVTMPILDTATLSGTGAIDIDAGEQASAVRTVLSGSGNISFDGSTPELRALLEGSGDIVARGSAERVDLRLEGSGAVKARDLKASSGLLIVSGSGDIDATVNGSAEAEISGSGQIDLYGDVSLARRSVHGSGDIRVH